MIPDSFLLTILKYSSAGKGQGLLNWKLNTHKICAIWHIYYWVPFIKAIERILKYLRCSSQSTFWSYVRPCRFRSKWCLKWNWEWKMFKKSNDRCIDIRFFRNIQIFVLFLFINVTDKMNNLYSALNFEKKARPHNKK